MKHLTRTLGAFALTAAFSMPVLAESGSVEMQSTSVGLGFGFNWGSGSFNIDGRDVPFTISGYRVADLGVIHTRPSGTVSNIDDVSEFEGTYTATSGMLFQIRHGGQNPEVRYELRRF